MRQPSTDQRGSLLFERDTVLIVLFTFIASLPLSTLAPYASPLSIGI
jgi:hypothetical protein